MLTTGEMREMREKFLGRVCGQGLVEYALIILCVALVVFPALMFLGPALLPGLQSVASAL